MSQAFHAGAADTLSSNPLRCEYVCEDSILMNVCDPLLPSHTGAESVLLFFKFE